jgi:nucleoside-diphosphate-sugar epimerase
VNNKEKYLITGAGGFIGGWIAETLHLTGKADVRAGIHRWSGAPRLARFPMEIVSCNIMNPEEIRKAMKDVTHVIHCAKGASAESIIKGTENMLEAALQNKVQRFVHMSTAAVYGDLAGLVDENCHFSKTGWDYADCKQEAEKICLAYQAKGLPVTILRPSIVYGPFCKVWILNIAFKILSGTWGLFKGIGEGTCNLIYISDLVNASLLSARDEHAIGEIFNLNGPEIPTWNEYFSKFNSTLGLPALREIDPGRTRLRSSLIAPIRAAALYSRKRFEGSIKKIAGRFEPIKNFLGDMERTIRLIPRKNELDLYNRKAYYSAKKIHRLLDFEPVVDVDTGLKLSVLWMDQVGIR